MTDYAETNPLAGALNPALFAEPLCCPAGSPDTCRQEPLSRLILSSISDVVEMIDPQGVIIYSNMPAERRIKLMLQELEGVPCHQAYSKLCESTDGCPLDEVLRTGCGLTVESPFDLNGGARGWTRQRLYPVKDNCGRVIGVLRLMFDITAEKRAQAKEAEYLSSLERSLYNREQDQPHHLAEDLSNREHQVLVYLSDGLSNLEIARLLCISPNTVKTHVVHIFNKLGVNDRTQAAVAATRLNLV